VTGPMAASTLHPAPPRRPRSRRCRGSREPRRALGTAPRPPPGRRRSRSDISATRQPAPCSACAIPRPIPCCPPVISAVPVMPRPPHRQRPLDRLGHPQAHGPRWSATGSPPPRWARRSRPRSRDWRGHAPAPRASTTLLAGSVPMRAVPHWCDGVRDRRPSTGSPGYPARRSAAFSFATSASCAAQFVRVQFSTMSPSFSVTRLSGLAGPRT
jgi:hypothetical protein